MAQAALGFELVSWRDANVAAVAAALAKEALAMNSPLDSAQRVLLFAALSRALVLERLPAAIAMHDTAVAMARRVGDPYALYCALGSITPAHWAPELLPKRLAAGREAMALAGRIGVADNVFGWHIGNLMEAGKIDEALAAMDFSGDSKWERYLPFVFGVLQMCRTMFALHAGRFADAERLARQQIPHATRHNMPEGYNTGSVHMFTLRREQGRLVEVAPRSKCSGATPRSRDLAARVRGAVPRTRPSRRHARRLRTARLRRLRRRVA
jgi:hypothetical protein